MTREEIASRSGGQSADGHGHDHGAHSDGVLFWQIACAVLAVLLVLSSVRRRASTASQEVIS